MSTSHYKNFRVGKFHVQLFYMMYGDEPGTCPRRCHARVKELRDLDPGVSPKTLAYFAARTIAAGQLALESRKARNADKSKIDAARVALEDMTRDHGKKCTAVDIANARAELLREKAAREQEDE